MLYASTLKPWINSLLVCWIHCLVDLGLCCAVLAAADLFLWRNKKISGGVLAGATSIWLLFEVLEYHLLTLFCHCLILTLGTLFLWSNASAFINK